MGPREFQDRGIYLVWVASGSSGDASPPPRHRAPRRHCDKMIAPMSLDGAEEATSDKRMVSCKPRCLQHVSVVQAWRDHLPVKPPRARAQGITNFIDFIDDLDVQVSAEALEQAYANGKLNEIRPTFAPRQDAPPHTVRLAYLRCEGFKPILLKFSHSKKVSTIA